MEKVIEIIVNGEKKYWDEPNISYDEVVLLAGFPLKDELLYSITYRKARYMGNGILTKSELITPQEGTVFNVSITSNS